MYFPILFACLITMLMWIPYLLGATLTRGMKSTLAGDPKENTETIPTWATRLQQAHYNAVENLPVFIGVCLVAELSQTSTMLMVGAAWAYCIARISHYVLYAFAIPLLRTTAFMAGWFSTLYIALATMFSLG